MTPRCRMFLLILRSEPLSYMSIDELFQLYKRVGVITTDSRSCPEGSLFLALRGETFDGNLFAVAALEKGCSYAIVDADKSALDASGKYHSRLIKVDDTLSTYKALARLHRRQYDIPVVAITGTNGKTTTKELIAAVLATTYRVMYTSGNYNNDVGVPKTLLTLSPEHDIAVVEMGASHRGDIKTLVETAEPTCGLITNVGRAHLEGFGDFEGVKATKGELYDYLAQNNRFAFVNPADDDLTAMARHRHLRTIDYAQGKVVSASAYLSVELVSGATINTRLVGAYNLANVLAAVSVGRYMKVPDEKIVSAIEAYEPHNNRSQLMLTASNELIVDAYNANPSSMAAALENFAQMESQRKKMLILGDMAELGGASQEEHKKVIALLSTLGFDDVWLVGSEFLKAKAPFPCFENVEEVKAEIAKEKPHDKCILIKGSNAVKLYELPKSL